MAYYSFPKLAPFVLFCKGITFPCSVPNNYLFGISGFTSNVVNPYNFFASGPNS